MEQQILSVFLTFTWTQGQRNTTFRVLATGLVLALVLIVDSKKNKDLGKQPRHVHVWIKAFLVHILEPGRV